MSTRMPAPNKKRHLRSRLVSPSRRLNARYDMVGIVHRTARPGLRAFLTRRTEVRGPPGQADALDRRATARARLPRPAVDAELLLVLALQPRPADVVADAR